jgi:hypothetical protein
MGIGGLLSFGGIWGFLLHTFLIYLGARIAKIENVGWIKPLVVSVGSYIVMALLVLCFALLMWIPGLRVLLGAAILFVATSVAAKYVFDCRWEVSWTIALVVALAHGVLGFIFGH